ncbi:hypothetical protein [Aquidulcibacter sp.]|uniref:hypothetical protein n=1 Tax=Aquidulcibacter sp. TaxID=2052990 RepID=UPI0025BCF65E|nr:hypothetical protein [Aquidulcibacter sp.]MCA3692763.1 hypothetical protein [Aquidulcibacter sp.]
MQTWKSPPPFLGKLWIWQYRQPKEGWRGWHVSADRAGAEAFITWINFLRSDDAAYRTLPLEVVSEPLLYGVGYNQACDQQFDKLRVAYSPDVSGLELVAQGNHLQLTIGATSCADLIACLERLARGEGDFVLYTTTTSGRLCWHFWWPPSA